MPEAGNPIATPELRLGTHPRHPDRPALLDDAGHAVATFPTGTTREEIADRLGEAGTLLHPDDSVTKPAPIAAPSRRALFARRPAQPSPARRWSCEARRHTFPGPSRTSLYRRQGESRNRR